jgi:hypothetical protein
LAIDRFRINFPFRWFRFSLRTWAIAALTWAKGEYTWAEPEHPEHYNVESILASCVPRL